MPFAVFIDFVFEHFLFGNIVGYHTFCGTSGRKFGKIPVLGIFGYIIGFENVYEFGERRGNPYARLVLYPLYSLKKRFFDNYGKVFFLLIVPRFVEVHEHGDERSLTVGGKKGNDLILYGLNTPFNFVAKAFFGYLIYKVGVGDTRFGEFFDDFLSYFLSAYIHERRKMGKRNRLPAVLVGSHLRYYLRRNIASRGKTMRLFDIRSAYNRAVLQHVFEIDEVAVMHVLSKIIGVVEVNDTRFVRGDYIFG